jgi:hypothetical protein
MSNGECFDMVAIQPESQLKISKVIIRTTTDDMWKW